LGRRKGAENQPVHAINREIPLTKLMGSRIPICTKEIFFLKKTIFSFRDYFFLIVSIGKGEIAEEEENKKALLVNKKGF
jgi:hypothetical protein